MVSITEHDVFEKVIRLKFVLAVILILIVSLGVIEVSLPPNYDNDFAIGPVERATFDAKYSAANETLLISVDEGFLTRKSGKVEIRSSSKNSSIELGRTKSDKVDSNIWAMRTIFASGIAGEGVTDFPLNPNDSVFVLNDETDDDGDDIYGVEEGDWITIYTKDEKSDARLRKIKIHDGRAFEMRIPMTFDRYLEQNTR